jgi:tripeptidyl-peptidase-1
VLQLTNGKELQSTSWSGGGFSLENYFSRDQNASYQSAAVNSYFSSGVSLPPQAKWNRDGRGFPDVSAQGVGYAVVEAGQIIAVSGTSASAPAFAGIVSLLNDVRLQNNKPTLGFLNPFIYSNTDSFNDITQGFNADGTLYGFHATKGWDPVTGVGTPNFPKLKVAVLKS